MDWNRLIRQTHRWLSLAFALMVIANLTALAMKLSAPWLGLMALVPLIPLLITGLYLFFLPHVARWRSAEA
jgi:hypothetical protein